MADPTPSHTQKEEELLHKARTELQRLHEYRKQISDGEDAQVTESIETFDFSQMGLTTIPAALTDLIHDVAQRLALNRNHLTGLSGLAPRLHEFTRLRYLVIRHNQITEFPQCILSVPTIEYLDLRSNQIDHLPTDLSRLTNLKNLSVENNNISKLPTCLARMQTLHILSTKRNPIIFPPKSEWKSKNRVPDMSDFAERSCDIEETRDLKRVLHGFLNAGKSLPGSQDEASDHAAETPRPHRRKPGSRFPIRPSIGSVDIHTPVPPVSPNPRVPQGTTKVQAKSPSPAMPASTVRPSLDPLMASERYRSSSESIVSTSVRKKRMGMQMSRGGQGSDQFDLQNMTAKASSLSPERAASLGPNLHTTNPPENTISPAHSEHSSYMNSSRLSSLAESKRKSQFNDPNVELANGIVFAMEQAHSPVKKMISLLRGRGLKPRGLERSCLSASNAKDDLSRTLAKLARYDEDHDHVKNAQHNSNVSLRHQCKAGIEAFEKMFAAVQADLGTIAEHGEPRQVRLLMHLAFASLLEIRNAYSRFFTMQHADLQQAPGVGVLSQTQKNAPESPRPQTSIRVRDRKRVRQNGINGQSYPRGDAAYSHSTPGPPDGFPPSRPHAKKSSQTHESGSLMTPALTHSNSVRSDSSMSEFAGETLDVMHMENIKLVRRAITASAKAIPRCRALFEGQRFDLASSPKDNSPKQKVVMTTLGLLEHVEAAGQLVDQQHSAAAGDPGYFGSPEMEAAYSKFVNAYSSLAKYMRSQAQVGLMTQEIKYHLKPLHRAIKEASAALDRYQCDNTNAFAGQTSSRSQHRKFQPPSLSLQTPSFFSSIYDPFEPTSATSAHSGASSGYVTPLPATPMSAALGPAASATAWPTNNLPDDRLPSSYYSTKPSVDRSRSVSQRRA